MSGFQLFAIERSRFCVFWIYTHSRYGIKNTGNINWVRLPMCMWTYEYIHTHAYMFRNVIVKRKRFSGKADKSFKIIFQSVSKVKKI